MKDTQKTQQKKREKKQKRRTNTCAETKVTNFFIK